MEQPAHAGPLADSRNSEHRGERSLLGTLACLAAVALLVAWRTTPPPALGEEAALERFSAARARAVLERLLADPVQAGAAGQAPPHPSGSPALTRLRDRLAAELERLGLEPEDHQALVQRGSRVARVRNLLARIEGTEPGPDDTPSAVLLVAHFDSVAAGPGASDDGAGVATLLETARALLAGPAPIRDVLLLFTDGEEDGLFGAHAFCEGHPWLARVGVALNFEARGTSGPSMLFQTSGPNRWLVDVAASALERPWASSVADLVYNSMPNDTDLSAFIEREVPGINFAFIGGLARYHTPLDDLAHQDPRSLQHHGDGALALARAFAGAGSTPALGGERPAGSAAFFDWLGLGIVRWPLALSLPLALAASAVGLAGLFRARAWAHAIRELPRAAGAFVASALGASAGPWLVSLARPETLAAPAHAWPFLLATCAGWLLALGAATPALPSQTVRLGGLAGVWLAHALAAIAAALLLPQVAYLALVPLAAASLALVLAPRSPWTVRLALAAAGLVWFPILEGLLLGFGFDLAPLIGLPLAAAGLWCWPELRAAGRSRRVVVVAAAGLVLGTAAAWLVPVHTPDVPGWLSLHHERLADGSETLLAEAHDERLPPAMEALARFEPEPRGGAASSSRDFRARLDPPTGTFTDPATSLEVLEGEQRVAWRIDPDSDARRWTVQLPAGVRLASLAIGPLVLAAPLGTSLEIVGAGGDPVVLELDCSGVDRSAGPVVAVLGLERPGLPPALAPFSRARGATLVPRSRGDRSTTWTRHVLP